MISKNKIKHIQSLHRKKGRDQEGVFLVEGDKLVKEALQSSFAVRSVCARLDFIMENKLDFSGEPELIEVDDAEMKKISTLQSPQRALAVVEMPEAALSEVGEGLSLALDGIQDPGNLGTIIRTADWFGVKNIYCSLDTADCFNPKVIQATMGAIFRVNMHYVDLPRLLARASAAGTTSYGTFMEGDNIYSIKLAKSSLLVMGNEGNGIRLETEKQLAKRITIPSYAHGGSESLNVGIATAVCLAEFRRCSRSKL
ncbi:MAG: TrmH family RNA methyltransferase [Mangrovibacterium sp.]